MVLLKTMKSKPLGGFDCFIGGFLSAIQDVGDGTIENVTNLETSVDFFLDK